MTSDRMNGCLIGLAIGDALGATLEFGPRIPKERYHVNMTGGGPFGLKPGEYTDDTAMAFAMGASIVTMRRFDPFDVAMNFASWYVRGKFSSNGRCFDIGNTTRAALERFIASKQPMDRADHAALGNGALMRLAPIPIAFSDNLDNVKGIADRQARITHNSNMNAAACSWLAVRLARQFTTQASLFHDVHGGDREIVAPFPELEAATMESWAAVDRDAVVSSGHVVDTLGAALWAIQTTKTFEGAVIEAVNLGDDSDTVGAVTGMIAGSIYGAASIPDRWLAKLVRRDDLEKLAKGLAAIRN